MTDRKSEFQKLKIIFEKPFSDSGRTFTTSQLSGHLASRILVGAALIRVLLVHVFHILGRL